MSYRFLIFLGLFFYGQNLLLGKELVLDKLNSKSGSCNSCDSCNSCNSCFSDACKIFTTPTSGCFCFDSNSDLLYPQQNSNFIVNTTSTPFEFQIYLFKPFYSGNIAASTSIIGSTLTISDITQAGFKISSSVASAGLICFLVSENSIVVINN